jgi:hypothetical protein
VRKQQQKKPRLQNSEGAVVAVVVHQCNTVWRASVTLVINSGEIILNLSKKNKIE